eukprot:523890-Alexandrium_andersonii.AAC.1
MTNRAGQQTQTPSEQATNAHIVARQARRARRDLCRMTKCDQGQHPRTRGENRGVERGQNATSGQ